MEQKLDVNRSMISQISVSIQNQQQQQQMQMEKDVDCLKKVSENFEFLQEQVKNMQQTVECLQREVASLKVSFMNNGNMTTVSVVVEEGQWICRDV